MELEQAPEAEGLVVQAPGTARAILGGGTRFLSAIVRSCACV